MRTAALIAIGVVAWIVMGIYSVIPPHDTLSAVVRLSCIGVNIALLMWAAFKHGKREANMNVIDQANTYVAWVKVEVKKRTGVDIDE